MRLFIALRFDERALKQLTAVQGKLCRSAARCSPVQRDSLHMTLAFLGEVENARTAALKHILDSLDRRRARCALTQWEALQTASGGADRGAARR